MEFHIFMLKLIQLDNLNPKLGLLHSRKAPLADSSVQIISGCVMQSRSPFKFPMNLKGQHTSLFLCCDNKWQTIDFLHYLTEL